MSENESKSLTVREGTVPAMSEPATGQYADMEQLDIQSMFDQLLKQANHAAQLEETMQSEIKAKKDFLYSEAKAGRDLFWVRGWHRGFTWVKEQIKKLHYWKSIKEQQAEKRAKEKASELPFGDDVA